MLYRAPGRRSAGRIPEMPAQSRQVSPDALPGERSSGGRSRTSVRLLRGKILPIEKLCAFSRFAHAGLDRTNVLKCKIGYAANAHPRRSSDLVLNRETSAGNAVQRAGHTCKAVFRAGPLPCSRERAFAKLPSALAKF